MADMNLFKSLDLDGDGSITREEFLNAFISAGLQLSDRRFSESLDQLEALAPKSRDTITPATFQKIIRPNIHLLRRVLKAQLILPDFNDFCSDLSQLFDLAKRNTAGTVANHIQQLARVDERHFALAVCSIDGQRYFRGDVLDRFTIQSTSKTISYCLALEELGRDKVHQYVGREPSGLGFNELTLNALGLPHNPMINAGAIMDCSLLGHEMDQADRFDFVMSKLSPMAGHNKPAFSYDVYLLERETAHRNRAPAHYMIEKRTFPELADLEQPLEFYFQCCSIELNADQMSIVAATLAKGSTCPITGEKIIKTSIT